MLKRNDPQEAALSPAVATSLVSSKRRQTRSKAVNPPSTPMYVELPDGPEPHTADIAAPDFLRHIADESISMFVRLEELDPPDPDQLSGARLWINETGEDTDVSADFGDTLQFDGNRTSHFLGSLRDLRTASLAVADPTAADEEFSVGFSECSDGPNDRVRLVFQCGENAELRLELAGYCLGVLRGELLNRFFYCVRKRRALKIAQ